MPKFKLWEFVSLPNGQRGEIVEVIADRDVRDSPVFTYTIRTHNRQGDSFIARYTEDVLAQIQEDESKTKKREGMTFKTAVPSQDGAVVAMIEHKGQIFMATQFAIYQLSDEMVFKKVKFRWEEEEES